MIHFCLKIRKNFGFWCHKSLEILFCDLSFLQFKEFFCSFVNGDNILGIFGFLLIGKITITNIFIDKFVWRLILNDWEKLLLSIFDIFLFFDIICISKAFEEIFWKFPMKNFQISFKIEARNRANKEKGN